jgi:hypothetical protein
MTGANFSNKNLGVGGAIIVSAWITHRDKGALSPANLLENDIGIEQASGLAAILKEHPALKSLCGNKGDETELDMSGKHMCAEGAIMLVPEIIDNGALSVLNLASNSPGAIVGWSHHPVNNSSCRYRHTDGRHTPGAAP